MPVWLTVTLSFLIPIVGCYAVVETGNELFFVLLFPFCIYMEGGILLAGVAILITSLLM